MFTIDLNEQTNIIQVKTNNENNSTVVGQGRFTVDIPDRTVLIHFNDVKISPENYEELSQFLSTIVSHVGQLYESLVGIRLPLIFDGRIDLEKMEFKNKISDFMAVKFGDLKYYPENNLNDKQEEYELITEKERILNYAEGIKKMMNQNAFWATEWSVKETENRIHSAVHTAMILDKKANAPCGFGRLLLLKNNDEMLGYISDIGIDISHQSQGLGRVLFNYLVGTCTTQEIKEKGINGALCLRCAFQGSGAVSASKLYRRSGFELLNQIGNQLALFSNTDHYHKIYE